MNKKISAHISKIIRHEFFQADPKTIVRLEKINQLMYRRLNNRERVADRNARLLANYIIEHYPAL
jgi:hypothetical protein